MGYECKLCEFATGNRKLIRGHIRVDHNKKNNLSGDYENK